MSAGIGNTTNIAPADPQVMLDNLASAVAQNQLFQSAMRAADNMNTMESMSTSLTLNSNTGQRKGLEASTEAQNQDNARRPQAVQGLYRA
jgi:hypothetical protein